MAFASRGIALNPETGATFALHLVDTASNIESLTPAQITALLADGLSSVTATTEPVLLTAAQAVAFEGPNPSNGIGVDPGVGGEVAVKDTAANIEKLTLSQIQYLRAGEIIATDASVVLTVAQAFYVTEFSEVGSNVSVPTGDTVSIADTAANIDQLGSTDINAFALLDSGNRIVSTDGSVVLTVDAAEALEQTNIGTTITVGAPAGDTVVLSDTAANIESMSGAQLAALASIGVSAVDVTDQSITLTVAQALALYDPVPITVPPGSIVIVADTESEIDSLTPAEVAGLAAIGVQEIDVSNLSGAGPLTIDGGITLSVSGAVPANETITFAGTGGTLALSDAIAGTDVAGTIYGFSPSGTIDLRDVSYDATGISENISGAALGTDPTDSDQAIVVTENGNTYYLDLDPAQVFLTTPTFALNPDSTGTGTDITENTTPCYCRGTRIQTRHGQKRVENLKIGDRVMTKAGVTRPIKWIGRRSYGGRFILRQKDILPICIKAGALDENVPRRDLWISPLHAMFFNDKDLNGVLIEAKDLVNGVSIVQAERVEKVEYFHVELDTHDVIVAEGALSESFIDDDSRGLFHNAYEYRLLYPDTAAATAQYCAPRLDHGYQVEDARRRIARRAQLLRAAEAPRTGPLRGYVDAVHPNRIEGWAQNADHPEAPVCLDVYADGKLIGQVLANQYREDLKEARIGNGHHSFVFVPPPGGLAFAFDAVEVRRSFDGHRLIRSGACNAQIASHKCASPDGVGQNTAQHFHFLAISDEAMEWPKIRGMAASPNCWHLCSRALLGWPRPALRGPRVIPHTQSPSLCLLPPVGQPICWPAFWLSA